MNNGKVFLILGIWLAFGAAGCGKGNDGTDQKAETAEAAEEAEAASAPQEAASKDAAAEDGSASGESGPTPPRLQFTPPVVAAAAPTSRLLTYHAEVRLRVDDLPSTTKRLDSLVQRSGGYLSAASETHEDGEWRQEMTLRLPPARFQATLQALARFGTVETKEITTDDVTAEHADVAARLGTKRAVEKRYVALLARAQKISDILAIEKQIAEVREEIESTESSLKTLDDDVAYSTVTLTCYQPISQAVPDAPVVSFGSRLVGGFYSGWELLTGLVVSLVGAWPLALLAGAGWWAVRRYRARRRAVAVPGLPPPMPPPMPPMVPQV